MKYRLRHTRDSGSRTSSVLPYGGKSSAGIKNALISTVRFLGRGLAMIALRSEDDNEFPWWEFK
jgi:hypothetical protein